MPVAHPQRRSPSKTLNDLFARSISYLRISLTDRCNLRCFYCRTEEEALGVLPKLRHVDLLSYEEILRVAKAAVSMGISKVRLTGGEPLLRRNVMAFIRDLSAIPGLDDIRITTNGLLLEKYAEELYQMGLRKVNISLDSLRPERVARITGQDCFDQVWASVRKVLALGFAPVKLNMVVMRHVNDDEVLDFARLSQKLPLQVRFIEFMPIGQSSRWQNDALVTNDELMARLRARGELIPLQQQHHDGPARVFRLGAEAIGSIGFISPISNHFCKNCNRLRLTSAGGLRSCLLHDEEIDLRPLLRRDNASDTDDTILQEALLKAVRNKPEGHDLARKIQETRANCHNCQGLMSRIGG